MPKGISTPAAIAATSTGNAVIVTGRIRDATGTVVNFGTVAYNPVSGARLWVRAYHNPNGQPEFATVAYDSGTGAQLWVARYGQPAKEPAYGVSVAVSPDSSKVFVTGDTGNDAATVAYNS